ncbi:hypothetical protein CLV28_2562 [Sediminihabitans luteus]|uniref:Uncharacterized protein n=1 Tax=Sediminihabitans luteus TaxID=1138585 RepID=A0A2M9CDS1_9CELL|nr:hypothetical protein [Sediminihabitans luteus]PJJ70084.1 hypothetical protein CLV28_2562 [Sediminihabitans luteus]GIJ00132.1 hypothetical protein Slu03_25090 [Sediminihabitans luteus]
MDERPGSDPADVAAWRAERTAAAEARAAGLERRRQRDSAEAARAIEEFLVRARAQGVEPVPLRARGYHGDATFRTGLRGWYLRANRTVGIDTDGRFYVLSVPTGPLTWLRGARPAASDPPLVLGAGGRDGESISMADALEKVLDAG